MTTIFDERERGEEARFRHELMLTFKIRNRRNKLLGLWIAEEFLGMAGEAAETYAKEVMLADLDLPGDADLLGKINADVVRAGKEISEHRLQRRLEELDVTAREQMLHG